MELSISTATAAIKTFENETETPIGPQTNKPLSFTNGVLKRHPPLHHLQHPVMVTYKECLKNHAATMGGHAVDGCGEFMPSAAANSSDPTSLKCAACGCHRNFHLRKTEESLTLPAPNTVAALEYHPRHRHHPLPPPNSSSPNSLSPPPISSSYYPSAPHMLLSLGSGLLGPPSDTNMPISAIVNPESSPWSNRRKRSRTKFTQDQKEKMLEFAENVGWKTQKTDEDTIKEFCREIGVDKGILKVWMHNNKNIFATRDHRTTDSKNSTFDTTTAASTHYNNHFHIDNNGGATDGLSSSS
ncbi:unnamed protein product [Fraxinus pennsylvanica]|uniref:ZF-HD dimerization-type domain-containing protein n=1 Tax=Fraxinus pennsylvanica TaxID=56036 RepID=A0AAD2E7C1_9LAMI|nr:unnamed protein product [Fraxinus pennsylvanica]